jgi:hypothetical protein
VVNVVVRVLVMVVDVVGLVVALVVCVVVGVVDSSLPASTNTLPMVERFCFVTVMPVFEISPPGPPRPPPMISRVVSGTSL